MKEKITYLFFLGVPGNAEEEEDSWVWRTCAAVSSLQSEPLQWVCPLVFQNLGGWFNSNLIQTRSEKIRKMAFITCLLASEVVTVTVALPPVNT